MPVVDVTTCTCKLAQSSTHLYGSTGCGTTSYLNRMPAGAVKSRRGHLGHDKPSAETGTNLHKFMRGDVFVESISLTSTMN